MRGSADVVDLCTPPPSPANDPENASVQQPPPAKRRATGASTAPSNRKARVTESVEPASAAVVDSDDDVMEVEAPVRKVVSHESQAGGDEPTKENEDDEVSFIGRSGELALSDFPHSRENCVCAPWRAGKEQKHCQNCFCYVCDAPVSDCKEWPSHCKASHANPAWRKVRQDAKEHRQREEQRFERERLAVSKRADAQAAAARRAATAASSSSHAGSSSARPHAVVRAPAAPVAPVAPAMSLEELLDAVQQVWPVEESAPPGLLSSIELRPYQKQTLAFCLERERSQQQDASWLGQRSFQEPMHPSATPRRSSRGERHGVRGGWICDEMGMGKTCCCVALMLANAKPAHVRGIERLTVVVVNINLLDQWHDEIKKFAPNLRVIKGVGGATDGDVDCAIVTPTLALEVFHGGPIHRLIIDESHLLDTPGSGWDTPKLWAKLRQIRPANIWMCTGTPITNAGFHCQASLLGHAAPDQGLKLSADPASFSAALVGQLQRVLIRHTKKQRIRGAAALALPEADCKTILLDQTADEKLLTAVARCCDGLPPWLTKTMPLLLSSTPLPPQQVVPLALCSRSNNSAGLATGLVRQFDACVGSFVDPASVLPANSPLLAQATAAYRRLHGDGGAAPGTGVAKFARLLQDVTRMVQAEPSARLVVFTQHATVQERLCALLSSIATLKVIAVSRKVPAEQRRRIFRAFQAEGDQSGAQALVCTYYTTAVGITLTAASRVYLFEPSLDPATELQAAGRIHRLGQTKEILIVRFAYRDTVEHALIKLHDGLKSGAIKASALQACGSNVPDAARRAFEECGCHSPHRLDLQRTPLIVNQGAWHSLYRVTQQQCLDCGASVDQHAVFVPHVCSSYSAPWTAVLGSVTEYRSWHGGPILHAAQPGEDVTRKKCAECGTHVELARRPHICANQLGKPFEVAIKGAQHPLFPFFYQYEAVQKRRCKSTGCGKLTEVSRRPLTSGGGELPWGFVHACVNASRMAISYGHHSSYPTAAQAASWGGKTPPGFWHTSYPPKLRGEEGKEE